MKTNLVRISAVFTLLFFLFTSESNAIKTFDSSQVSESQFICYSCRFDQCHAIAKSTGERCRHCVSTSGDIYCWQHQ
jgi:hypothetical protein